MNRRVTGLALAGAIAVGGLGAGAVIAPALASETTPPSATDEATDGSTEDTTEDTAADRLAGRVTAIREALEDLVTGGTLTAEQADAVADDLAEDLPGRGGHGGTGGGPGGHGPGGHGGRLLDLLAAADALGISPDELRTGLADGSTLVEIAEADGVATEDLVAAMVEAAQSRLDELVASGELTQAEADTRADGLQERVETLVEQGGFGRGGHGPGMPGDTDGTEPTPSASQSST